MRHEAIEELLPKLVLIRQLKDLRDLFPRLFKLRRLAMSVQSFRETAVVALVETAVDLVDVCEGYAEALLVLVVEGCWVTDALVGVGVAEADG